MAFIGIGVIMLCILWALSISACALCAVTARREGPLAHSWVVILVITLLLTIALWAKYRSDQERRLEGDQIVLYDYSIVGRSAILALTGTALLAGLYFIFAFHITAQRKASRLSPWSV